MFVLFGTAISVQLMKLEQDQRTADQFFPFRTTISVQLITLDQDPPTADQFFPFSTAISVQLITLDQDPPTADQFFPFRTPISVQLITQNVGQQIKPDQCRSDKNSQRWSQISYSQIAEISGGTETRKLAFTFIITTCYMLS